MTYQHNDFSPPQRETHKRADYTTYDGAQALIERIKAHWERQGFAPPEIKAVLVSGDAKSRNGDLMRRRYELRSDMRGGMPAKMEAWSDT